jgi:sensor histidine kinase YesM
MVPPMMIQPLLENAIAYGMQTAAGPLEVEVSARVAAGQLEVVVANSGGWGSGWPTCRRRSSPASAAPR